MLDRAVFDRRVFDRRVFDRRVFDRRVFDRRVFDRAALDEPGLDRTSRMRRTVTGLVGACLAASLAAGCTGGDDASSKGSAEPSPTAAAEPAVRVRVTRVAGTLKPAARHKLEAALRGPLDSYVQEAFLGDYPRADFADAFATFTAGAARRAARDSATLTGAPLAKADEVSAEKLTAYLSVLAPRGKVAGVTAKVHFAFATDLAGAERSTLDGRLFLTVEQGHWRIFGYDVARSDRPATGGDG